MAALTIQMFGGLCISHQHRTWCPSENCKIQELFCYLLLHRNAPCSREALASQFWGESTTEQSKRNLRQALWRLQTTYSPYLASSDDHLVELRSERVRLNPAIDLWVDADVFAEAFALLRPQQQLSEDAARLLREAVALYRGDFLDGWYHDWCLIERERFQNMYLEMLDRLIGDCLLRQEYQAGLQYTEHLLRCNPASERTWRQSMKLHYFAGDRAKALQQFDRCTKALHDELGVAPARRTQILVEQIRADCLVTASSASSASTGDDAPSLHEVLLHLRQLQASLAEMQQQVRQDIHQVERLLPGITDT